MQISDGQLDEVVASWSEYAEKSPAKIEPEDMVKKRDMNMYRGLGITTGAQLAERLVRDRSVASMEMTMGHLYERLLEELGPLKVTREEKSQIGFQGIDFRHYLAGNLRLINLKAGLSTSNGDISQATIGNLTRAKEYWQQHQGADDNPLKQKVRQIEMVRAVARGVSRKTITEEGILWLVGEAMWTYFGAGSNVLVRLGRALGKRPLDYERYQERLKTAEDRTLRYLEQQSLVDASGVVRWDEMIERFP